MNRVGVGWGVGAGQEVLTIGRHSHQLHLACVNPRKAPPVGERWLWWELEAVPLPKEGVGEDSWECLGLQGDQTSQSSRKSVLNIHGRTDAEAETPTFWPPHIWANSLEKTLMMEKLEGKRRRWQRMRRLDSITDSMEMNLSKLQEAV